jgi:hypothetical protein
MYGLGLLLVGCLDNGLSEILPAEFFLQHAAQKQACCITSCTWISFQTIQNHPLDVSRSIVMVGKKWFGSFVGWLPG